MAKKEKSNGTFNTSITSKHMYLQNIERDFVFISYKLKSPDIHSFYIGQYQLAESYFFLLLLFLGCVQIINGA